MAILALDDTNAWDEEGELDLRGEIASLECRLIERPYDVNTNLDLYELLRKSGKRKDLDKAEEIIVFLSNQDQESTRFAMVAARFYSEAQQYKDANFYLRRVLDSEISSNEEKGIASYFLGHNYLATHQYNVALAHFLEAKDHAPDTFTASCYTHIGFALVKLGQDHLALDYLEKAIGQGVQDVQTHLLLARTNHVLGKTYSAIEHLDQIIAGSEYANDQKATILVHNARADYLIKIGNFTEAADDLQRVVEIDPSFPDAFTKMGIAFAKQGLESEASQAFENATIYAPAGHTTDIYLHRASMLLEVGLNDEAIDVLLLVAKSSTRKEKKGEALKALYTIPLN